jgi:colanic acid biosynthesis glycosyl transferase WcaI
VTRRILLHDFSGHPFQLQLSRELAARGNEVLHVHCTSYATGKGATERKADDPATFQVHGIDLGKEWNRYSWIRRLPEELGYGRRFVRCAEEFGPDVVISSNDPLFAKAVSARWCAKTETPWVFWLQDIYSVAMAGYARQQVPLVGRILGGAFQGLEGRMLRRAGAVVAITEDFVPDLMRWRVRLTDVSVIENWAPIDEMPMRDRQNPWSAAHGLDDRFVVLYAGTLGMKHDPTVLLEAARHLPSATVVVVSEGRGADWLRTEKAAHQVDNLEILPYQDWDAMPDVLGSADALVVLLEPDAGIYSVPSKLLTYLAAGRPIVAAIPDGNRAARTLRHAEAGVVLAPGDRAGFIEAVEGLADDPGLCARMGKSGREYAEHAFDIGTIADRFTEAIDHALGEGTLQARAGLGRPGHRR